MTVYLVGAGPGDPALLTVRAAELLAGAGALVHDRLVDERVLALAPASAPRFDVGKRPGSPVDQAEINQLLVRLAGEHDCVVRLKGGDPYLFGRGGEEALALSAAGVAYEVVPGVSSVNGALAYAGIPATHRGLAACVSVVTGHSAHGGEDAGPPVDWDAIGRAGGTIVVLMGVAHRAEIAERLIAAGRSPATPVAVVQHGTTPRQATLRTTLAGLAATEPETPAIIVVGEVAALALGGSEDRPLLGWRVVVSRSRRQASRLSLALAAAGAIPVEVPAIEIAEAGDGGAALDAALRRITTFDWVAFSSANAVEKVFDRLVDAREFGGVRVAAIGGETARALADRGVVADLVPAVAVAEELAAAFGEAPSGGASVLVPQGDRARPALAEALGSLGYRVETVEAYRTVQPSLDPGARALVAGAHALTFTSGSTVEGLCSLVGPEALPPVIASIGPVTSRAITERGLRVDAQASRATVESLVEALAAYASGRPRPG